MDIRICVKESFCVIGKEGSTFDGEGFIQRLWDDANSHFNEVAPLAKTDAEGNIVGIWGAMSDVSRTFKPWENGFTQGLYLAGIECLVTANPPTGWTKWVVPSHTYVYVENQGGDTFPATIQYLKDNGLSLAGAVHDFTCPEEGKSYLFFPIQQLDISLFSSHYQVKRIAAEDIPGVYDLCKSNAYYYQHCPPLVTIDSIKADMVALPKGKTPADKYYVGFYSDNVLIAIMDLIIKYPNSETAFIGLFMMNQQMQRTGIGSAIITELCQHLKEIGFSFIRLGYAKGNLQSNGFWTENQFKKTGTEVPAEGHTIVLMERTL